MAKSGSRICSPSRQAFNSALRLANFLRTDNLQVFVNSAVIWANQESHLLVENPSVVVWLYNRLPDEVGNRERNYPNWSVIRLQINFLNYVNSKRNLISTKPPKHEVQGGCYWLQCQSRVHGYNINP